MSDKCDEPPKTIHKRKPQSEIKEEIEAFYKNCKTSYRRKFQKGLH